MEKERVHGTKPQLEILLQTNKEGMLLQMVIQQDMQLFVANKMKCGIRLLQLFHLW